MKPIFALSTGWTMDTMSICLTSPISHQLQCHSNAMTSSLRDIFSCFVVVQQICQLDNFIVSVCNYLKLSLKLHCYGVSFSMSCTKHTHTHKTLVVFTLLVVLIRLLAKIRECTWVTSCKRNRLKGLEKSTCCCLLALGVNRYIMVTFQDVLISNKIEAPLFGVQAIHYQHSSDSPASQTRQLIYLPP